MAKKQEHVLELVSTGIHRTINIDNIDETCLVYCVSEECKDKNHEISLKLKDPGKWTETKGYADPKKGFKVPKMFARKTMRWSGKCKKCKREYDATLRVLQGE